VHAKADVKISFISAYRIKPETENNGKKLRNFLMAKRPWRQRLLTAVILKAAGHRSTPQNVPNYTARMNLQVVHSPINL